MPAMLDHPSPCTRLVSEEGLVPADRPGPDPIARAVEGAPPPGDASAKRVLLLEDDPSFREVIKEFLCESGYTVHEARSGLDGIQEIMAGDFGIILCDMQMPGLAGDLFFRAVERSRPELCERFIFMTGQRGDACSNAFIESASGQVLMKPFHLDTLIEAIAEMERRRCARRQKPQADSAVAAEPPSCRAATSEVKSQEKRVLLLEDDPSFREVIKEFLTETGYTVKEAQSGVEGIREIFAGDFAVVLCDMMMPGLAGDLFYRAVERARPHLCERFIFMTGHRGDSPTNDFIQSMRGHALMKPFHLGQLLEAIDGLATRRPAVPKMVSRREETLPSAPFISRPPARSVGDFEKTAAAPAAAPSPLAVSGRDLRAAVGSTTGDYHTEESFGWLPKIRARIILTVCTGLTGAFFVGWWTTLEKRYNVLSTDLAIAENEWNEISKEMPEAERARNKLQTLLSSPKRLQEDRAAPRWTAALPTIVASREGDIELQGLHARQMAEAPGACELRIDGVSFGPNARITADRFRLKIEEELQRGQNSAPVKTGFLRLAEVSASRSAPSNQQRLTFEIIATVGIKDPAIFKRFLRY